MAWSSHGFDQKSLVENLEYNNIVKTKVVRDALLKIDRKYFCAINQDPYQDSPQKIGFGAMISAPHMHAHALEALAEKLVIGNKVMDVGSGSGYLTACFAIMVGKTGKVVGIEHIEELVEKSRSNIKSCDSELLENDRILLLTGDGKVGYEPEATYDAIHVGAAADNIPTKLIEQLKPGGRLMIPVGKPFESQTIVQVDKNVNGDVTEKKLMSVRFVPLTSVEQQMTQRTDVEWEYEGKGDFSMLINDTLLHVFSYLCLQDWLALEQVSKRWYALIRKQWKVLERVTLCELAGVDPTRAFACEIQYFTPHIKAKTIEKLISRCGKSLTTVKSGCKMRMDAQCLSLFASCPRIKCLDFSKVIFVSDLWEGFEIESTFENVVVLQLDESFDESVGSYHETDTVDCLLFKIFASMPNLKTLSLAHNTMIQGNCLFGLRNSLEKLSLDFCRRVSSETLISAFTQFPNLCHIPLYSCHKISGSCLSYLPECLESVDLSYCNAFDELSLVYFFRCHPNLQTLHVAHVDGMTDQVLAEIVNLGKLKKINIGSYFTQETNGHFFHQCDISLGIKHICTIDTLFSLDLSKNTFVTDNCLSQLGVYCPNLQELDVSQLSNCSALGFKTLGQCHSLKKLDISCNQCIDKQVLIAIGSCAKLLEFVNSHGCFQITPEVLRHLKGVWINAETVFQIY